MLHELADVTQVSLGNHHACALVSDGMVKCWGKNDYGQLGLGEDVVLPECDGLCTSVPTPVKDPW